MAYINTRFVSRSKSTNNNNHYYLTKVKTTLNDQIVDFSNAWKIESIFIFYF